ncbi:AraC family transcriptional regulator [Bacterioplanoides pacificum]|uniref:AraC family transcriptional regulator n=1 Tax=Bacterioplanoides pacificum TaxID=1171596 RepID=A0ABV7VQG5_9GAMM
MSQQVVLPGFYLHQLAEVVAGYGVNTAEWLESLQVPQPQADNNAMSLSWEQFRQMVLQACELTGEPSFGLLVGQRLLVNTHGILGYAAMNAGSVRQGAELVEKFLSLRTDLVRVEVEERDDDYRLHFIERFDLGDIRQPVLEAIILAIKNVLDFIAMADANACTVCFPFAPDADSGFLQSLFRCRVQYQQDWAGIHLPKELADKPLLMANSGSYRDALEICQKELEKIQQNSSLTDRIYRLMLSNNNSFPSLELTARYFHMTPRTLHRRLQQEDTSYKDILDQVRQRLAIQYLDSGKMTVQEVAYSLGYSEVANFRRAFKRWHGIPPSDYLKQQ